MSGELMESGGQVSTVERTPPLHTSSNAHVLHVGGLGQGTTCSYHEGEVAPFFREGTRSLGLILMAIQ